MRLRTPPFTNSAAPSDAIYSAELPRHVESWLLAGDISQHTERTIQTRRERLGKLIWFLDHKSLDMCGLVELRQFFQYLNHGHKEPGGRWGNPACTKPVSSGNVKSYHSSISTFFNWLVQEGVISDTPMRRITPPVDRPDQIAPFTNADLLAIIACAKKSTINPKREEAMVLLLLDTGIRVSELCGANRSDVDLQAGQLIVKHGKGNKTRALFFSRDTKRALYNYFNQPGNTGAFDAGEETPLFLAERGENVGGRLTRSGVDKIVRRICTAAGITGVRCSPHTFRHTMAVSFIRNGGEAFSLKEMLGHTALSMTNRYVSLAKVDLQNQHRRFSPVANLKLSGKKG